MEYANDGVMLGFIQSPCGKEHSIAMHGAVDELVEAANIIGLTADPSQIEQMSNGEPVTLLFFSDGYGSHVTMQPVTEAREFLAGI